MDTPKDHTSPAVWASLSAVKLTQKTNQPTAGPTTYLHGFPLAATTEHRRLGGRKSTVTV